MNQFESDVKRTAMTAARKASEILLANLGRLNSSEIKTKQQYDFVTRVDLESEKVIIDTINEQFPSHDIFAEEQGSSLRKSEFLWIIDPLDGTTNFIHSFPFFSISIALKQAGSIIFGVVLDPLRDECFWAGKGQGAFLNEKKISVSSETDFSRALIATGFPFHDKSKVDLYLTSFAEVFQQVAGIRRAGSAALDLSYTACGRVDGFWEIGLHAWDIAAGALILQEAGGIITDFLGQDCFLENGNVAAGSPLFHPKLLEICREKLGNLSNP